MADRIVVVRSTDLGKTFSEPVAVTPEPMNLDWGPTRGPASWSTRRAAWSSPSRSSRIATSTDAPSTRVRRTTARASQAAADHRRCDQPAFRDGGRRSLDGSRLRDMARQAQRAEGPRRRQALSRRGARLCWEDGEAGFGRPASPSTIPANAAGSASHSPAPASRPWCSATSSPARSATMASSPSRTRRRRDRYAASAPTNGRSRPARIMALASRSCPTAPITSPGSPTVRRARACSMPVR